MGAQIGISGATDFGRFGVFSAVLGSTNDGFCPRTISYATLRRVTVYDGITKNRGKSGDAIAVKCSSAYEPTETKFFSPRTHCMY